MACHKPGSVLFQKLLKLHVGLLVSDQSRMSRHEETLWIGRRMCRQPPIQQLHGFESVWQTVELWLNTLKFWKVSAGCQPVFLPASPALTNRICSSSVTSEGFNKKRAPSSTSQRQQLKQLLGKKCLCIAAVWITNRPAQQMQGKGHFLLLTLNQFSF